MLNKVGRHLMQLFLLLFFLEVRDVDEIDASKRWGHGGRAGQRVGGYCLGPPKSTGNLEVSRELAYTGFWMLSEAAVVAKLSKFASSCEKLPWQLGHTVAMETAISSPVSFCPRHLSSIFTSLWVNPFCPPAACEWRRRVNTGHRWIMPHLCSVTVITSVRVSMAPAGMWILAGNKIRSLEKYIEGNQGPIFAVLS